jgi:hypothetical protein
MSVVALFLKVPSAAAYSMLRYLSAAGPTTAMRAMQTAVWS